MKRVIHDLNKDVYNSIQSQFPTALTLMHNDSQICTVSIAPDVLLKSYGIETILVIGDQTIEFLPLDFSVITLE